MKKSSAIIVSFLLLGHLVLSLSAARRLSPTWDEIGYPVTGALALTTRSLEFYPYNPFLARVAYGVPALMLTPGGAATLAELRMTPDASAAGFRWLYQTVKSPRIALIATRLPAIFFSLIAALLLFFISFRLFGASGGVISLLCYLSMPIFLSRASLALLEMPMIAFMLAALAAHQQWVLKKRISWLISAGVCTALATLCKLVALPLMAVLVVSFCFDRSTRFRATTVYVATFAAVFVGGFLFWRGGLDSLYATWADAFQFNQRFPFYWRGGYRDNAPSLLSWGALAVKAPPVIVALGLWSFPSWRARLRSSELRPWIFLPLVYFGLPLFFSAPVSTVQLSPLYLGFAVLSGALGLVWEGKNLTAKAALVSLLILGWIDVARVHPNYLAYFNSFSGGLSGGSYWLADSDQDWGQSLPSLARELKRRPPGLLLLSYSGAADPDAEGLSYVDLVSAAIVSRVHKNPPLPEHGVGPIYLAIGTKMMQIAPDFFAWLENSRKPEKLIDGTFRLYDLSHDDEALRWVGNCFQVLKRKEESEWFYAEAAKRAASQTGIR